MFHYYLSIQCIADETREAIRQAMADFAKYTCITFQPHTGELDYIRISAGRSGCHAQVGRVGGAQKVNLDNVGCAIKATAIHELMHTLGFDHEQNRPDRNAYVIVHRENVQPSIRIKT